MKAAFIMSLPSGAHWSLVPSHNSPPLPPKVLRVPQADFAQGALKAGTDPGCCTHLGLRWHYGPLPWLCPPPSISTGNILGNFDSVSVLLGSALVFFVVVSPPPIGNNGVWGHFGGGITWTL